MIHSSWVDLHVLNLVMFKGRAYLFQFERVVAFSILLNYYVCDSQGKVLTALM